MRVGLGRVSHAPDPTLDPDLQKRVAGLPAPKTLWGGSKWVKTGAGQAGLDPRPAPLPSLSAYIRICMQKQNVIYVDNKMSFMLITKCHLC